MAPRARDDPAAAERRMDDQGEDGLDRTPTAAWLAEQEAKQAAYAARRRTWTRRLGSGSF